MPLVGNGVEGVVELEEVVELKEVVELEGVVGLEKVEVVDACDQEEEEELSMLVFLECIPPTVPLITAPTMMIPSTIKTGHNCLRLSPHHILLRPRS
jgi:hypothetical protein